MPFWHRIVIAAVVFGFVSLLARLIDWWLRRRPLAAEATTRYRVLRRTITVTILVVGLFSALLVIPQVRAIAGGLLASSAVLGVIIGFASQRTLGNFVAGILIALSQPVRLGDRVVYDGVEGVIEEIGLTYTFIRTNDNSRLVVPNEKLASDAIRNASIRSRETFGAITVQLPLAADVGAAVEGLRGEFADLDRAVVELSALGTEATVTIRAPARDADEARQLEGELRLRTHSRLRALGTWS
jgi:small-conductance mechanosensitive channel